MHPRTDARHLDAILDLPAGNVADAARWSHNATRLTLAELIDLTCRLAERRRTMPDGPAFDDVRAKVNVMWDALEGELERRLGK